MALESIRGPCRLAQRGGAPLSRRVNHFAIPVPAGKLMIPRPTTITDQRGVRTRGPLAAPVRGAV